MIEIAGGIVTAVVALCVLLMILGGILGR